MVDWQSESDLDSIRNSCDVSIIFCKPSYPFWRCFWGSSLPYLQHLPSQSRSSACRQGCHPWLKQACPRDGRSAICDYWETCPLCEKPSCSTYDCLTFIIQYIYSYLVKPTLIWEKLQKWQSHLDLKNSGFGFLFREMCHHNLDGVPIWLPAASGLGNQTTIIIRDNPFWCKY